MLCCSYAAGTDRVRSDIICPRARTITNCAILRYPCVIDPLRRFLIREILKCLFELSASSEFPGETQKKVTSSGIAVTSNMYSCLRALGLTYLHKNVPARIRRPAYCSRIRYAAAQVIFRRLHRPSSGWENAVQYCTPANTYTHHIPVMST